LFKQLIKGLWGGLVIKRKVIQIANSTQLISLPRKWAQKYSIKKGDELDIEEEGSSLKVSVDKGLQVEKVEVDVSGIGVMAKRVIAALYKSGYDEVHVKFSTTEELKYVQEVLKETCIGFEITSQEKNSLTAKAISSAVYSEFDSILRRSFLFLSSMIRESLEAIKKQDTTSLNNTILMDDNLDKFTDFCRRILNKKGYPTFRKTPPVYYIVEELEKIGDECKDICELLVKNPVKINKDTIAVYSEIAEFFDFFHELFYKFELAKVTVFEKKKDDLNKKIGLLLDKSGRDEVKVLLHLSILVDKIFNLNGALMAAAL